MQQAVIVRKQESYNTDQTTPLPSVWILKIQEILRKLLN
jgi:hypothetical protein